MKSIILSDTTIEYEIIRSNRKSIAMSIISAQTITIKAPRFMPEFLITQFIKKNEQWILTQSARYNQSKEFRLFPEFKNGAFIPFFGKHYPLELSESKLAKIPHLYFIENSFQIITKPGLTEKQKYTEIKKLFKNWIMKELKEDLTQRIDFWAQKMNLTYNTIRIKDVKGHWGSCSIRKNLNFNYRIALLPMEGIDYIIIHELSHLKEMNHSVRFWQIVEEFMPNYKQVRANLKKKAIEVD